MKQKLFIFSFTFLLCNCLFGQSNKDSYTYLSTISKNEAQISKRFLSFASSLAHDNSARKVEFRRKDLIKAVAQARDKIAAMPCLNNDCTLRDSIVSFLKLQYYVLNDDFEKILNMEEIAEDSYDLMEAYMNARSKASEKIHIGGEAIDKLYKSFALLHGVVLSEREDKISLEIEKIDKVLDHYNTIYLIFFKSYKQEAYLIKALNDKDFSGAEQNRNALNTTALEGLGKLDTVKAFQNDKSLIIACHHTLAFFKMEASDKISILIDYWMKNENFEKLHKTIGSKDPILRSKDETDQYNAAIKEYNNAGKKYNSVNNGLNKQRTSIINEWNTSGTNFLAKYIPDTNKKK